MPKNTSNEISRIIESLQNGLRPWGVDTIYGDIDYGLAENFINATGAKFHYGGVRAYYVRPTPAGSWPNHITGDYIQIPHRHQYIDSSEFYVTCYHELSHWTQIRLGWSGTESAEELLAEQVANNLAVETHIPNFSMENHEKYAEGWLKEIKNNPNWYFEINTVASQVTEYLLNFQA